MLEVFPGSTSAPSAVLVPSVSQLCVSVLAKLCPAQVGRVNENIWPRMSDDAVTHPLSTSGGCGHGWSILTECWGFCKERGSPVAGFIENTQIRVVI